MPGDVNKHQLKNRFFNTDNKDVDCTIVKFDAHKLTEVYTYAKSVDANVIFIQQFGIYIMITTSRHVKDYIRFYSDIQSNNQTTVQYYMYVILNE